MQPQLNCLPCPHLRPCVQTALHRRGKIRLVDAPATSKVAGFFKRWSDNKLANAKKENDGRLKICNGFRGLVSAPIYVFLK